MKPVGDIGIIPNAGVLVSNQHLVEELQRAVQNAPRDIESLRLALAEVLHRDPPAYMDRIDPHRGARFQYQREELLTFITDQHPKGLQTTLEQLRKLLKGYPEARLLDHVIEEPLESTEERDQRLASQAQDAGKKGGRGREGDSQGADGTLAIAHGSNHVSYLVRRLKRDAPEIAEALARGDYPSARAAAKAAGIIKPPTPLQALQRAWAKASDDDRIALLVGLDPADWQTLVEIVAAQRPRQPE